MFSLYHTLSFRYLQHRWMRAILIILCIALGVATLVATRALNHTLEKAAAASSNPLAGMVDFVLSNGDLSVPSNLAQEVQAIRGVKSVKARLFEMANLPCLKNNASVLVLGIDLNETMDDFKDNAGLVQIFPSQEAILIKGAAAKLFQKVPVLLGKELDREIPPGMEYFDLEKNQEKHPLAKVGMVEGKGDYAVLSGHLILMEMNDAAKVLGYAPGQVTRIDVALDKNVDPEKIRKEIESKVGNRALVRTPLEQNQSLQSVLGGMQSAFAICGLAALVIGLFLVYNALSVSVAERRHEIGILLSLGATPDQIRLLFTGESAILGMVGSLVGIPLGMGLAHLSLLPVQDALQEIFGTMLARQMEFSWGLFGYAFVAGVFTTILASLVPAWQAAAEKPASAVRRVVTVTRGKFLFPLLASSFLISTGVLLVLFRGQLPARVGSFGGMIVVLVGALVAAPFFAGLIARALQPLVRGFLPLEWRLGIDNLVRAPGRTGLVIGAIAAGVALVVQTAGVIQSNRDALREWVQSSITADLFVTSGNLAQTGGQVNPLNDRHTAELEAIPEIQVVLPIRTAKLIFRETQIAMVAVDIDKAKNHEAFQRSKDFVKLGLLQTAKQGCIVSENFAALHGFRKGDQLVFASPKGKVEFEILDELVDYTWTHGTVLINRREYRQIWGDDKIDLFDLFLRPGADPIKVKEKIEIQMGARYQIKPLTRKEFQQTIDQIVEKLYGIAYGQQIIVMIVACLGAVTALLISVLQRRREMGLLRAIGASRFQIVRSVLAEGCLMGIIGTGLGLIVGIPMQWYALHVVLLEESGFLFPVRIPWTGGSLVAIAGVVTATLAGIGPALVAVRGRIPDAIAYE